jgi:tRNA(Ile)-lysidine synthase
VAGARGDDALLNDVAHGDGALRNDVAQALSETAGPVYVGFSGGLDSTVLLHASADVLTHQQGRVRALHVNHGLHADADAWERHCGRVAAELGVRFIARRVNVAPNGSLEAHARAARYAAFAACLDTADSVLLLAHHRDDQAETVLLRLLQGRGLYGMPAARRLGAGWLMRPLLGQPRAQLLAYARAAGLTWIDDPANADPALDRNFVRHRILPELRTRFPGVDDALIRATAARQAEEARLAAALGLDLAEASLPLEVLLAAEPDEQRTVLRLWLAAHGHVIPAARALDEFVRQLRTEAERHPCLELDRGALRRHRGHVWLCAAPPTLAERYPVTTPGEVALPHGRLSIIPATSGFSCRGAVTVRFRAGGERIRTHGGTRFIKALMQEAGIAPWLRASWPLVCDADGVAAVPGLAVRDAEPGAAVPLFQARWVPDDPAG